MSISEAILAELADLPYYQYLDAADINNLKSWLQRDTDEVKNDLAMLKDAAAAAKAEVLTQGCFEQLKLPAGFSLNPDNANTVVDRIAVKEGQQITVTNKVLMHIMFGDYDEYGAFTSGGHTLTSLDLRDSIVYNIQNLDPSIHEKLATGKAGTQKDYHFRTFGYDPHSMEKLENGCFTCSVLQKYKEQKQIFFPEDWTWETVKQAIKDTYEQGKYDNNKATSSITCKVYTSQTNNIRTKIHFKSTGHKTLQLVTCYAEAQNSK